MFAGQEKDVESIEFFCNPNAHVSSFDAKVLITLCWYGVQVSSELRLEDLVAGIRTAEPIQ